MIVSHTHKFIFLKTKKTAGTEHRACLERAVRDPDDVITPLTEIDEAQARWKTRRAELAAAWLVGQPAVPCGSGAG
jgi:hypothetical protein